MAVSPNSDIIVGGSSWDASGKAVMAIAALFPDGTPDVNFGPNGDGKITYGFGIDCPLGVRALAIYPDGSIVAVGEIVLSAYNNEPIAEIIRFTPTGAIDPTFNGGSPFLLGYWEPSSVVLQVDGKIVVGATYKGNMGVFRLNGNGTLDTNFGTGGHILIPGDAANGGGTTSVAFLKNGNIVWAGAYDYWDMQVAECNFEGMMISNFGGNGSGVAKITVNGNDICHINGIRIDSRNRIITAGSYYAPSIDKEEFLLCALKSDGTLDNTFAGNGKLGVPITNSCHGNALWVQPNDQIDVVGFSDDPMTEKKWVLCRVNKDGTLDGTFGTGGKVTTPFPGSDFNAAYGAFGDRDGKLVVAGYTLTSFGTARYLTTGTKTAAVEADSVFGSNAMIPEDAATGLSLYPNPAHSQLTVRGLDAGGRTIIFVRDAAGKTVANATVNSLSEYTLDIHQLAPGTYFLELRDETKHRTRTFVKVL